MVTNAHCSKAQPPERLKNPRDSHEGCPGTVYEYYGTYGSNKRMVVTCACECHQEVTV